MFGQIQTSQTEGQPYSDTSPYGECSLYIPSKPIVNFRQNEPLPFLGTVRLSSQETNETLVEKETDPNVFISIRL